MDLATDTPECIFVAADSLHEQAGRAGFSTGDAVRKTARVSMNDASVGMKRWSPAYVAGAAGGCAGSGKCPAGGSDRLGGIVARCAAGCQSGIACGARCLEYGALRG